VIAREIDVKDFGAVTARERPDHDLEGEFGRRAVTERAEGILMERHSVDDADALEMLRDQSRRANNKLADVAAAVVDGHRLLPKQPDVSQTARQSYGRLLVSSRDAEDRYHLYLVSLGVHDVGARDAAEPTRALSLADEFPGMHFPSPSSTQA
jgi:hypothetical protein